MSGMGVSVDFTQKLYVPVRNVKKMKNCNVRGNPTRRRTPLPVTTTGCNIALSVSAVQKMQIAWSIQPWGEAIQTCARHILLSCLTTVLRIKIFVGKWKSLKLIFGWLYGLLSQPSIEIISMEKSFALHRSELNFFSLDDTFLNSRSNLMLKIWKMSGLTWSVISWRFSYNNSPCNYWYQFIPSRQIVKRIYKCTSHQWVIILIS